MIQTQREFGADSRLLTLKGSKLHQRAREAGVPVFETDREGFFKLSQALFRISDNFKFEILHLHGSQDFNALVPWLAIFKRNKFKVILQFHIWLSHKKRDVLHWLKFLFVDEIWCSSERARRSLAKVLPIPIRKLRVVNYGRKIDEIRSGFLERGEARKELGLPLDATIIGSVARIDPGKGTHEVVFGSLDLMKENTSLHVVLVGSPTEETTAISFAKTLYAQIEALPAKTRSRFHLLGNVPNSFRYLKAFDIFVVATYAECFSLALLEAQLARLPVIATNSGGSPEVVVPDKTGWLFQPASTESFKRALKNALRERSRWVEYGERASSNVEHNYDTQQVLKQTLDEYEKLLESQC
jgi:glycosyltransferase involved in cell wall biosynthesis